MKAKYPVNGLELPLEEEDIIQHPALKHSDKDPLDLYMKVRIKGTQQKVRVNFGRILFGDNQEES